MGNSPDPLETEDAARDIVALLIELFPEVAQTKAHQLLIGTILPYRLRSLAFHPNPLGIVEAVTTDLRRRLEDAPGAARLGVLEGQVAKGEAEKAWRQARSLAVARYLSAHPEAMREAMDWVDESVRTWLGRPLAELEAEANRALADLDIWVDGTRRDHPDIWEQERLLILQARHALTSAASGAFSRAEGSLADFLDQVGADFDHTHIV